MAGIDEQSRNSGNGKRPLPGWARWVMVVLVIAGVAVAFYFNFGRLMGRVFD